ncbi:putative reverse transcriptase domain-containing protein [Tanacetum coccineum]
MPPKMMKRKAVKKMVKKRVEAIAEYEKTRAKLDNAEGSGSVNTGGVVASNVQGCTHKTFMNEDKVMFAASTFESCALTWWNRNVHTLGLVNANHIPWNEFKTLMTTEYFPATKIQRMKQELWTLTLKGDDIKAYNYHFHELALMCPDLVPTEKKKVERQEAAKVYVAALTDRRNYAENAPYCNKCRLHHYGQCPLECGKCHKIGNPEKDYRVRIPGHLRNKCPKGRNQQNEGARGRAYVVVETPHQNPNVVTCTFLLNDHYASVLFDSGAERSFVSTEFTPFIDIALAALNTSYEVELADGKVVSTNTDLRGCTQQCS